MNNIHNIEISKEFIENLIFDYTGVKMIVNNIHKFQQAFIHKSFWNYDNGNDIADSCCTLDIPYKGNNERFEFLGDRVIDLIVTDYLFDKFFDKAEGFLTTLKSRIVKTEALCKLAKELNFHKNILISCHIEKINGRLCSDSLMENLFEAFIGVLYKDQNCNIDIVRKFLLAVIEKHVDIYKIIDNNDNFKDILMRYLHSIKMNVPIYKVISVKATVQNKEYMSIVCVEKTLKINDFDNVDTINKKLLTDNEFQEYIKDDNYYILGIGETGDTKKISEQRAAFNAIKKLNISLKF
jgi:dsRNA-specific ribonuclease